MSRERETYRLELEQVMAAFPNKAVLNRTDVMAYTGRKRTWLDNHGFTAREFTRTDVAHILACLHEQQNRRRKKAC